MKGPFAEDRMMEKILPWLDEGDVSIRCLAAGIVGSLDPEAVEGLRRRIPLEGFGKRFLESRNEDGHWGLHYYQPKWTSTHYVLTDLMNLGAPRDTPACAEMVGRMFRECATPEGGLNLARHKHPSDVCVDGMILAYAATFRPGEPGIAALIDALLGAQRPDGGFTWDRRSECGDPHTTVSVLEGFDAARAAGIRHRAGDLEGATRKALAYLLQHRLFCDDPDRRFRRLTHPHRYRYDLLRGLSCFARACAPFDERMLPALAWLTGKRGADGTWRLEFVHPGAVHFAMEDVGAPSRFLTLEALAVLKYASSVRPPRGPSAASDRSAGDEADERQGEPR